MHSLGVAVQDHGFAIDHLLEPEELDRLRDRHLPHLLALSARYCPSINVVEQFPVSPIFVDCLRALWRQDSATDRPSREVVESGIGFAFGLLLSASTALRWHLAKDAAGEFITMARTGASGETISIPPFSYVAKRHDVENAEVFREFFQQIPAHVIGFVEPPNWLLEE